MPVIEPRLLQKLSTLQPTHLQIQNESPEHGLPLSAEKHFRVVIVSSRFSGLTRVERHQMVHALVATELREHVHAFALQTFTPEEWQAVNAPLVTSPPCLGGGKREGVE